MLLNSLTLQCSTVRLTNKFDFTAHSLDVAYNSEMDQSGIRDTTDCSERDPQVQLGPGANRQVSGERLGALGSVKPVAVHVLVVLSTTTKLWRAVAQVFRDYRRTFQESGENRDAECGISSRY